MVLIRQIRNPNHHPVVDSFPGCDSESHHPTVVLRTCHNSTEKVSPETRDFLADVARPKRDVASSRVSARIRARLPTRNLLQELAIDRGGVVGLGMSARENPTVTNFAAVGFKWYEADRLREYNRDISKLNYHK
jgi:hypothetical protein